MTYRRTTWLGVGLVVMAIGVLGAAGCQDEVDPIGGYCSIHFYCYPDTDFNGCMEDRESEEELALAKGEVCHDAFLAYHTCIGELSCFELDAYFATGEHCGTLYNTWQNRCSD